jgi:hypothetical protein
VQEHATGRCAAPFSRDECPLGHPRPHAQVEIDTASLHKFHEKGIEDSSEKQFRKDEET